MRGVHLFMFVVALPALAALGHDAYLFYMNQDKGFELAALGFIWTKYEPESYRWTVEVTEPEVRDALAEHDLLAVVVGTGIEFHPSDAEARLAT